MGLFGALADHLGDRGAAGDHDDRCEDQGEAAEEHDLGQGGEREVRLQQQRADENRDERLEHEHGRDDLGRPHAL